VTAVDAELEARLRATAAQSPEDPARDSSPWDAIARELDAEAREARLRPLVEKLLRDGDAVVRRRAVDALMALGARPSVEALLAAARAAHQWGEQRSDEREPPLRDRMQHALANVAAGSGRERAIAQAIVAIAGPHLPHASTASVLGKWAAERLPLLAARFAADAASEPFFVTAAATVALYRRDELQLLLPRLRPMARPAREALLARLVEDLAVDEARVAAIVEAVALPRPKRAPFTADELRAALGL